MIRFEDWRPPIVEMVAAKEQLAKLDPHGANPFFLPEMAASEEAVAAAEKMVGAEFEGEHRRFLTFADGWASFFQRIAILGTGDFGHGPLWAAAQTVLVESEDFIAEQGWDVAALVPVAASTEQADLFVMVRQNDGAVGEQVLWIAEGELIDTFDTFGQFFVSMIDYTRLIIRKRQEAAPTD